MQQINAHDKIMTSLSLFFMLFVFSLSCIPTSSDDAAYAQSLLKFKQSLTNTNMLDNWESEPVGSLCSRWTGVVCKNDSFSGLRLENMSLGGKMDVDSLSDLPLFSLSVANNNLSGPFPSEINKLGQLRRLFLGNNSFSGEIPDDAFRGMKALWQVELGFNFFTGKIPLSLTKLQKLEVLQLQNNRFQGRIPDFFQPNLRVNFSNNHFDGAIPASLRNQDASSFLGNGDLCGAPLGTCKAKPSIKKIALVIAAIVVVALAALIILLLLRRRRAQPLKHEKSVDNNSQAKEPNGVTYKNSEHRKLQFVRNDRENVELEDLLMASAQVLGSGSLGSSYKAVLLTGQPYVVRRFRQMNNVGNHAFIEHMTRLGRLSHPNLLPLLAFYYTKEEKLLVSDFVHNGSLASHLHGKRTGDQPGLDWAARLRIIKGVARGLSYLHKQLPTLALPHGHLKSSNVLLDATCEPLVSDYALTPMMNKDHAQHLMVAYKSPESLQNDTVTRKTDVWSLGILILELLTGRFPANYLKEGREPGADLATWVNSVVREEWTGEVFDEEMSLARNAEGQMLRLLKIGMCCCECNVGRRWDLNAAVEKIEGLKERDVDDEYSTSYASEGDVYSSVQGGTDDDFSFSRA